MQNHKLDDGLNKSPTVMVGDKKTTTTIADHDF